MDAVDLLRRQHAQARELLEEVRRTDGDERRVWLGELVDHLSAHADLEQKLFYPAVAHVSDEHAALGRALAEADLPAIEEHLARHVEQLEELFRRARQDVDPERLRTLGVQMKRMFEEQICSLPTERARAM